MNWAQGPGPEELTAQDDTAHLWRLGSAFIDPLGVILLGAAIATVAACWLAVAARRRLAARGRMDPVAAGQLRLAAARGRVTDLELLSSLPGFQVDAACGGFTALHAAAVGGHADAISWLLRRGADMTLLKDDGWRDTALHYAAGSGSREAVRALLAFGADPAAKNALGSTPADVAASAGHRALAALLQGVASGSLPRPAREEFPLPAPAAGGGTALAIQQQGEADAGAAPMQRKLSTHIVQWWNGLFKPGGEAWDGLGLEAGLGWAGLEGPAAGEGKPAAAAAAAGRPATPRVVPITAFAGRPAASGIPAATGSSAATRPAGSRAAQVDEAGRKEAAAKLAKRAFEGWGTPGTVPRRECRLLWPLGALTQLLGVAYLTWRALRTLRHGWALFYSVPFWLVEFAGHCLSYCFLLGLIKMVERPPRRLSDMLPEPAYPHVDVYVVTYSEPADVVEPTVIAALNMTWPAAKLTVYVLDDGRRAEMAGMVRRLAAQCRHMQRPANVVYVARDKVKGVPHHAKAGNINSALLKGGGKGDFVLILDCDMVVHPDLLQRSLGHMYRQEGDGGQWVPKPQAGFVQTPQDFFNVCAKDPLVHCSRFFYGPMLQGRDGIGACSCCGTGVVFRRDVLVSIGGQAYGSITEDFNTSMVLLSAGMSTMYLNERLSYGLAPEAIQDVFAQRLRWSMGGLQVLVRNCPLLVPGLTLPQALLFFDAAAHNFLALSTLMMAAVPIVYLFTQQSPMACRNVWEFLVAFCSWYGCNRLMMLHLHWRTEGGLQELWHNSQTWLWMAPNQLKALWRVLVTDNSLYRRIFKYEITFKVTRKDRPEGAEEGGSQRWRELRAALWACWPHLAYTATFLAAIILWVVRSATGHYSTSQVLMCASSVAWGLLVMLSIYPPLLTLLPREETEQGWKVCWHPFAHPDAKLTTQEKPARRLGMDLLRSLSRALSGALPGGGRAASGASTGSAASSPKWASAASSPKAGSPGGSSPAGGASPVVSPKAHRPPPGRSRLGPAGTGGQGSAQGGGSAVGGAEHIALQLEGQMGSGGALPTVAEDTTELQPAASLHSPSAAVLHHHRASAFGRVGMRGRREAMLQQTALLTGMVLPERSSSLASATSMLLMDAAGHAVPAAAAPLAQRANSVHLGSLSAAGTGTGSGPGTGAGGAAAAPAAGQPPGLGQALRPCRITAGAQRAQQQRALSRLALVTGAGCQGLAGWGAAKAEEGSVVVTVESPPAEERTESAAADSPTAAALQAAASLAASDASSGASGYATPFASPFALAADRAFTTSAGEGPGEEEDAVSASKPGHDAGSPPNAASPAGKEDDASLGGASAPAPQVAALAASLAGIACALSPGASCQLQRGESMAVPVVPTSIYEHSLMATPSFDNRAVPPTSAMFVLVNALVFAALAASAALNAEFRA